jgi:hypothetical protein
MFSKIHAVRPVGCLGKRDFCPEQRKLIIKVFTKSRNSRGSTARGSVLAAQRLICKGGTPEQ